MTEQAYRNWPDLSEFNAELKILRGNAYRPPRLCLALQGAPVSYSALLESLAARTGDVKVAILAAGFDLDESIELNQLLNTVQSGNFLLFGHLDGELSISLEQLQILFPTFSAKDIHPAHVDTITKMDRYLNDHTVQWQNFLKSHNDSQFTHSWTSTSVEQIDNATLKTDSIEPLNRHAPLLLEKLGFQHPVFRRIYPTKKSALIAGISPEQVRQITLPFALPIAYDKSNHSVIVIDDIRQLKDFAYSNPESIVYPHHPSRFPISCARYFSYFEEEAKAFLSTIVDYGVNDNKERFVCLCRTLQNVVADFEERVDFTLFPASVFNANDDIDFEETLANYLTCYVVGQTPEQERVLAAVLHSLEAPLQSDASQDEFELFGQLETSSQAAFSPEVIQDTGEKIGGARKDFYRKALGIEDLQNFLPEEKELLVNKANVWPALNYEELRDSGCELLAAVCLKTIKDSIPVKPAKLRGKSAEECFELYIQTVALIKEQLESVKTHAEMMEKCKNLHYMLDGDDQRYGQGVNDKFAMLSRKTCQLIFFPRTLLTKVKQFYNKQSLDHDDPWAILIKEKKPKSVGELTEKDKEKRALRELDKILHTPHLEHISRMSRDPSNDWRQGRHIAAQDFIDTFGFRGVEFGNWLPQAERQEVLNLAYDSFCDLAYALELNNQDISLGNKLAIAFGSRGKGGKRAAMAHYEPVLNVINLTRLKGAGSLAHEWIHAMDRYFGEGNFATEKRLPSFMPVLNSMIYRVNTGERQVEHIKQEAIKRGIELAECIARLKLTDVPGMYEKNDFYEVGQQRKLLDVAIEKLVNEMFERNEAVIEALYQAKMPTTKSQEIEFTEEVRGLFFAEDAGLFGNNPSLMSQHQFNKEFCSIWSDVYGTHLSTVQIPSSLVPKLNFLANTVLDADIESAKMRNEPDYQPFPSLVNTQFMLDAQYMDRKMGYKRVYWGDSKELLARAGAAYVHDKLEQKGVSNNYLIAGSEASRIFYKGNDVGDFSPNPRGIERE